MIASFGDKGTEALYHGGPSKPRFPPDVVPVALRKLDMLNSAQALSDPPPGNRLEALSGALTGHHSIRVNDQWWLIFRWEGSDAHEARLIDHH